MEINVIYKISEYPLIWLSTGGKNWRFLKNDTNCSAYLLVHPMWQFRWTSLILYFNHYQSLRKKNIKMILLNNSEEENRFAKLFRFESYLINQNIHCCEHIFNVDNSIVKKFDAIYIAAAAKYKRLELASLIKNLFILTYFYPVVRNSKGEWDLYSYEPKLKHSNFNRFPMNKDEVCTKINESKCGLALSKKEGAMWASIEYLLCGIPIVSTKSKGGRDFFFSKGNCIIAKDTAEAIRDSVNEITQRKYNSIDIRNKTLLLMKQYRLKFISLVSDLCERNNCEAPNEVDLYYRIWGNGKGISNIRLD